MFTVVASAKKKALPEVVEHAFAEKYANAKKVSFKLKKDNYRIKFKQNKTSVTATFSKDGEWVSSETSVRAADLPTQVNNVVAKKYKDGNYSKAILFESPKSTFYKITVDTPNAVFDLEVNKAGKIIRTDKLDKIKPEPISAGNNGNDVNDGGSSE